MTANVKIKCQTWLRVDICIELVLPASFYAENKTTYTSLAALKTIYFTNKHTHLKVYFQSSHLTQELPVVPFKCESLFHKSTPCSAEQLSKT